MEIIEVKTNNERRVYLEFISQVYKNDIHYKDMNIIFVKKFLYQKDSYAKRCQVYPLIIKDQSIRAVGMYISSSDSDELKLSFLEFLPNSKIYLQTIIEYGKKLIIKNKLKRIVIGINGHISYGLGILINEEYEFEFNSNYNPAYYIDELDSLGFIKRKAYSYCFDLAKTTKTFNEDLLKPIYQEYTFRCFNPRKFKEEMLIFGDLCDQTLQGTPYYSLKTKAEMYELMNEMRFVLKKEDLIFALKDGQEVGFVFAHPDYAELFNRQIFNKFIFFLKFLFKKPEKLIYNIYGVKKEYQSKGLSVALINESIKVRNKKPYYQAVSSFILEENLPSIKVANIFSKGINRIFNLYIVEATDV